MSIWTKILGIPDKPATSVTVYTEPATSGPPTLQPKKTPYPQYCEVCSNRLQLWKRSHFDTVTGEETVILLLAICKDKIKYPGLYSSHTAYTLDKPESQWQNKSNNRFEEYDYVKVKE